MKKIFCMAAMVLCLGIAATSCKKDNAEAPAEIENLGGGIYTINGARFVDLGLPSGLLWAECNVGASSDTEIGGRYAWGETEVKEKYTQDNYKYGADESNYSKYCEKDGKKVLEAADDAATAMLGAPCRTPLFDEFYELINGDYTTREWTSKTTSDGKTVYGYEVKSKTNSNSIFFPALRHADTSDPTGEYWCADLYVSSDGVLYYELAGHRLFRYAAGDNGWGSNSRWCSAEIRPVAEISK